MITSLNHLTLTTQNLARSLHFYVHLLGCKPEARWHQGAYLSAGDLWLCLSVDEVKPAADYTHIAFEVASGTYRQVVAKLEGAGVEQWKRNTSEGDSFYFLDPDGHKLEIHEGSLASRIAAVNLAPYEGWEVFDANATTQEGQS